MTAILSSPHFQEVWQIVSFFAPIFALKVLENILDSTRVILLQKNKGLIAGLCLFCSAFINYYVIRIIAQSNGVATMTVAAAAAGIGCSLASMISMRFIRSPHTEVIMSDSDTAINEIHNFLTEKHVKHVIVDSYNKDQTKKTKTIMAYPSTLFATRALHRFIEESGTKFGHVDLQ